MSRFLQEVEMRGFYELVGDAFVYPLRGQGKSLLAVGALFFLAVGWVTAALGLVGWIISALLGGYLCAFMFRIVSRSALGDPEPPGWPDISDPYDDIVRPLLLVVGAVVVAMLPAIVLAVGHRANGWQTVTAAWVAFAVGLVYLPMAVLGVCLNETFLMAGPHVVIPAILKVPLEYLTVCAALGAIVLLQSVARVMVFGHLPFVGGLLAQFLSLYCLMLEMRILGVLYYTRQQRLGWFT
jgi:hypothetical protein